jgi:hypothetical protein
MKHARERLARLAKLASDMNFVAMIEDADSPPALCWFDEWHAILKLDVLGCGCEVIAEVGACAHDAERRRYLMVCPASRFEFEPNCYCIHFATPAISYFQNTVFNYLLVYSPSMAAPSRPQVKQ